VLGQSGSSHASYMKAQQNEQHDKVQHPAQPIEDAPNEGQDTADVLPMAMFVTLIYKNSVHIRYRSLTSYNLLGGVLGGEVPLLSKKADCSSFFRRKTPLPQDSACTDSFIHD